MSTDSDFRPAVSALRSRFEQLASTEGGNKQPSKQLDTHEQLSQDSGRQRALSIGEAGDGLQVATEQHLRQSSSSSDLKRRQPPPPPSRASKTLSSAELSTPLSRPQPISITSAPPGQTSTIHNVDRTTLVTRKPPPPPSPGVAHSDVDESSRVDVASLRSKFSTAPAVPSTMHKPSGNRIVSHPNIMSPTPPPFIAHKQRYSLSTLSPTLIDLDEKAGMVETSPISPLPPPLPTRPMQHPSSTGSSSSSSEELHHDGSESPASRSTSDSEHSSDLFSRVASPPPTLPKRPTVQPPPTRRATTHQSSAYSHSTSESSLSSVSDISNSTATLQPPPPRLPVRRSPPHPFRDLPSHIKPPTRSLSFQELDSHEGLVSAPPALERKAIGNFALPPPTRSIALGDKLPPPRKTSEDNFSDSSDEEETSTKGGVRPPDLLPDASNSSRRPPVLSSELFERARLNVTAHTGLIAVSGSYCIVANQHVKIYNLSVSESPISTVEFRDTVLDVRVKDLRVTCMEFRPADSETERGRFLWLATRDGHLWELDIYLGSITGTRPSAHAGVITHIFRYQRSMITLDDSGKILIFSSDPHGCSTMLTLSQPRIVRIAEKQGFARIMFGKLWTSSGSGSGSGSGASFPTSTPSNGHSTATSKGPSIRLYDIFSQTFSHNSLIPSTRVGAVTSGTLLQSRPEHVYLGHEGGWVSIWRMDPSGGGTPVFEEAVKVSASDVLCMEGVHNRLWIGGRKGTISAYDIEQMPWVVTNSWNAHSDLPVQKLFIDPFSIEKCAQLTVVSVGRDEQARLWDGLLGTDRVDCELSKREDEFSTFRPINVLVVSWNVDAAKPEALNGAPENTGFLESVLHSVDSPDIIVFGFQELIDLESRKMVAKTVLLGSKKKTANGTISEKVSRSYKLWHDKLVLAVRLAMPAACPYTVVHAENLVGLFSCIFVKNAERTGLKDAAITTVKRGIAGMYGNKGGIVARFAIDDSSICFINCHLAAGQHHTRARNNDVAAILEEKEVFKPAQAGEDPVAYAGGGDGSMVLDHEIVFLSGDLNYRVEMRRDVAIAAVNMNQLDQLLLQDQLLKEMKFNRGFRLRSFCESPITFQPTYKYDRRSSQYDTSGKSRVPAWCDRILYRCRQSSRVQPLHYQRYEANISDHRPISAGFRITVKSVNREKRLHIKEEVKDIWMVQQQSLLGDIYTFYASHDII